jgi:hypothetical protein
MATLIVLFNLKPGVSSADYEQWAKSVDLPTVNALASVEQFKVFRTQGLLGSDQAAPYQYVETIEVRDMPGLFADISTLTMQKVAAEFQAVADAPIFIVGQSLT